MILDLGIFNFINGFAGQWAWLDFLGIFCAVYLGYILLFALVLFLVKDFNKYWRMVLQAVIAAFFVRFVLVQIFYFLRFRFRPLIYDNFNLLIPYDVHQTSFPSGHASFYFALSTIIFAYHKKAGIVFYIASTFIVLGRVFVGVHWPSDIIAGAILGIIMGLILNKIFSIIKIKNMSENINENVPQFEKTTELKEKELKNKYFVLRHGESKANVAEIILSHLENGVKEEFTLTENGEQQVRDSVEKMKAEGLLDGNTIIYSSPFSRCKRTAEIAKEILEVKDEIHFDDRLRERNFGDLEKTHNSNYQKVWDKDLEDPHHKNDSVESDHEVQDRTLSLIDDLEKQYQGKKILLVSHGDALQILQTGFLGKSPKEHRQLEHLKTAEIRELKN